MAYQSLYRRYRPRRFGDMRGQEHIVLSLRNAVRDDRVGHAYLFSGPRGTGKTTSARILAKVLNCTNVQEGEPCCECASCLAVDAGHSFDVHELDAASNNGVDAMRELIERTMTGTPGRHKVYILDEVHMLSKAAEAALLKTLEEPPPHVVFVLATTDPQKVSQTIVSRCQPLQFHLIAADVLADHVRWVVADAGLTIAAEAVDVVVRMGNGSARDTLSALEQVIASGGTAPEEAPLDEVIEALIDSDPGRAVTAVAAATQSGRDARTLTEQLVGQLRDCFLSLMAPELVQLPDKVAVRVADQAQRLGAAATVKALETLGELLVELRHAPDPRLLLDVALVRLTRADADGSTAGLAARVEKLERAVAARATARPAGATGATGAAGLSASGSSPAANASAVPTNPTGRATLGARAGRSAAAPPAAARQTVSSPAAAPPTDASPTVDATSPPAPVEPTSAPAASNAGPPTVDELQQAWSATIQPALKGRAKAFFARGRFITADRPTFGAPADMPIARLEDSRADVDAALAKHFGRKVSFTIVHDTDGPDAAPVRPRPGSGGPQTTVSQAEDDYESFDPSELIDAPVNPADEFERITDAFPGSQLLDEQD
jgi:DNA polymerase III subunit gamma/tau